MDPDATMRLILSALAALKAGEDPDTREYAVEHLRDLAAWLERGGFPPQGHYVEKGGAP
jgi:hypothetical protein